MKFIFWEKFKDEIGAFTTTREDGYSLGGFTSLNLAFHVGDDESIVAKNRNKLFSQLNLPVVITKQSHSTTAINVTKADVNKGLDSFESGLDGDALFTSEKNIALGIHHADCVPVFIYIPSKKIVAIIHAGEQGSLNGITKETLSQIINKYDVKTNDIYAYLGPSLKFSHRIISKRKAEKIVATYPEYGKGVKATLPNYFLDLPLVNYIQLREVGVPSVNIDLYSGCTLEDEQDFFSFARDKKTGRNMSFIYLK